MLRIAVCDDSRTDVEMLEAAFDELPDYPVEYDVYFSGKELLMCSMQDKENYHLYIFDIEMPDMNGNGERKAYYQVRSYSNLSSDDFVKKLCYPGSGLNKGDVAK